MTNCDPACAIVPPPLIAFVARDKLNSRATREWSLVHHAVRNRPCSFRGPPPPRSTSAIRVQCEQLPARLDSFARPSEYTFLSHTPVALVPWSSSARASFCRPTEVGMNYTRQGPVECGQHPIAEKRVPAPGPKCCAAKWCEQLVHPRRSGCQRIQGRVELGKIDPERRFHG